MFRDQQFLPTKNDRTTVAVALSALDRLAAHAFAKRPGGGFAARPCLAASAATLRRFRRVNAVKPDALGVNLEGVANGRRGHTWNAGAGCAGREEGQGEESGSTNH